MLAVAEGRAVARAAGLRVHLVVLLQYEVLLPAVEIKAVFARLLHQLRQLARGQGPDPAFRMHPDPVQHLVLDDVADAGEDLLVQQRVGSQRIGPRAQLAARGRRVPGVGHHVAAPVVVVVEGALQEPQRGGVEVQHFAPAEAERQARGGVPLLVDPVAAEQQEVHALAEAAEFEQEVLAPAPYRNHLAPAHAADVLPAVAGDPQHLAAGEPGRGLAQDDDGGTFGHARSMAAVPMRQASREVLPHGSSEGLVESQLLRATAARVPSSRDWPGSDARTASITDITGGSMNNKLSVAILAALMTGVAFASA